MNSCRLRPFRVLECLLHILAACLLVEFSLKLSRVSWPFYSYRSSQNGALRSFPSRGVGGTVVSESALRSTGTLLSRVGAPLPAPWPDAGPKGLRSFCCGLAICKNQNLSIEVLQHFMAS
ncbi:hypothetical protein PoB_000949500 [Plakobranchus ocellatus]|uniref:Secreted protein n=1 Tax=Plakobranchus ocellatus TaxID=259542 RepID=A0AAV3YKH9_9GAST|nr:hypothetical protein PoB_000949500 [Plakobranchus ocellatus]